MDTFKRYIKLLFQYEAKYILKKYNPKIIAIVGSVGKTTTKDALYTVLSKHFFVRKSEKSFTTNLGVPLAIIGCPVGHGTVVEWIQNLLVGLRLIVFKTHYPDFLILELDTDKPGDLESVSALLSVDILVLTAIGSVPSHIESFGSFETFLAEKKKIIQAVTREGVVVYNADDEYAGRLATQSENQTISCGTTPDCLVRGDAGEILYGSNKNLSVPTGMAFHISFADTTERVVVLNSLGIQNEYAMLLAFAVAQKLGISGTDIVRTLGSYKAPVGRMNIIGGIKDTTVIDDSYNASPLSVQSAVETMRNMNVVGNKIVVIGDMLELGKYSVDEHKKVAGMIKDVFSFVICVGVRARTIAEELLALGFGEENILQVNTAGEAGLFLQEKIQTGDVVLVKGSQLMRMERVVEEVIRHPEDADKLLVRHDEEWIRRG